MHKNRTISVVVPAYNEAQFIGEVIKTIPDYVDRVFVVNDCSNDNTLKICESIKTDRLDIISHAKRSGPGAAMISGYKKACEGKFDVTAIMAGDGQMDPQILVDIIEPVCSGKADYSKGDRLSIPANRQGMPSLRRFGNRLLTFIIRTASGYKHISDPLNGYTAISKEALMKLDLDNIESGYAFETDLLIKLGGVNANVVNVDMPARYRGEKSKLAYLKFMIYTSWVILRDYAWRLKKTRKKAVKIKNADAKSRESESC